MDEATADALRKAVEEQARAHVAGDAAAFASWMTPAATVELGRTAEQARGIRPKRFRIISTSTDDDGGGASEVGYEGAGSYVISQRWELHDGDWKAVSAERPSESIRQRWWRRVFARPAPTPERRDLS